MSLIRKHVAVLQAWACLDLVKPQHAVGFWLRFSGLVIACAVVNNSFKNLCVICA